MVEFQELVELERDERMCCSPYEVSWSVGSFAC